MTARPRTTRFSNKTASSSSSTPKGSFLYLDGTEIDYVEDIMGSGFRFSNPNGYCQIERVTDRMGE